MATATIENTRRALRADTAHALATRLKDQAIAIDQGPLEGVKVVSAGKIDDIVVELLADPLPAVDALSAEVATGKNPAKVVVWAECPACGIKQALSVEITPSLVIDTTGRELKLHAKSKGRTHSCGQTAVETGPDNGQSSFELEDIIGAETGPGDGVEVAEGETATIEGDGDIVAPIVEDETDVRPTGEVNVDELRGEAERSTFAPKVGDPVVIDGTKHRIKTVDATTYHAKASFGKSQASGALDSLRWDDTAGVWREDDRDSDLLPE